MNTCDIDCDIIQPRSSRPEFSGWRISHDWLLEYLRLAMWFFVISVAFFLRSCPGIRAIGRWQKPERLVWCASSSFWQLLPALSFMGLCHLISGSTGWLQGNPLGWFLGSTRGSPLWSRFGFTKAWSVTGWFGEHVSGHDTMATMVNDTRTDGKCKRNNPPKRPIFFHELLQFTQKMPDFKKFQGEECFQLLQWDERHQVA